MSGILWLAMVEECELARKKGSVKRMNDLQALTIAANEYSRRELGSVGVGEWEVEAGGGRQSRGNHPPPALVPLTGQWRKNPLQIHELDDVFTTRSGPLQAPDDGLSAYDWLRTRILQRSWGATLRHAES